MSKVLLAFVCTLSLTFLCTTWADEPEDILLLIKDVSVKPQAFNPTSEEEVEISYSLSKDAEVTVKVFDPDNGLIKVLVSEEELKAGENKHIWDGKDIDDKIVPNQAYFFTIEADSGDGEVAVYDSKTFSGGEEIDMANVNLDREANTISFKLPKPAWVLGRLGIKNGPLMKTLLNWEPRIAGENTVFWNGKDESNVVNIIDVPGFSMMVTSMTLPDGSVISIGNKELSYRDYKDTVAKDRLMKAVRVEVARDEPVKISKHYALPRAKDRAPRFTLSFPDVTERTEDGVPVIRRRTMLNVVLDEKDREFITGQRFEIAFYVDYIIYAEEEEGYTPFNWMWDPSGIADGEHILTANVISLNDQVGAASLKFMVQKPEEPEPGGGEPDEAQQE